MGWYRHKKFSPVESTPEESNKIAELARIIEAGGGQVTVVPEIQRMKFRKNFWNVAYSSWSTLTS